MFNQGAFNQMPFNRPFSVDVYASFVLDSGGDMFVSGIAEMHGAFMLQSELQTLFSALQDKIGSFLIESTAELSASAVRERYGAFVINCTGELSVVAGRNRVEFIEFTGDFAPGDNIVIDSDKMTFLINGQNALHLMEGDFLNLRPGENTLTYTDQGTGRTVKMKIEHRDRWV